MTALAFAAKHTPKTLRSPQKRARPSEGSVAFPKGGDIPGSVAFPKGGDIPARVGH